jgi:hypothetical protein
VRTSVMPPEAPPTVAVLEDRPESYQSSIPITEGTAEESPTRRAPWTVAVKGIVRLAHPAPTIQLLSLPSASITTLAAGGTQEKHPTASTSGTAPQDIHVPAVPMALRTAEDKLNTQPPAPLNRTGMATSSLRETPPPRRLLPCWP